MCTFTLIYAGTHVCEVFIILLCCYPLTLPPMSLRNWDKDQVSDQTNHFIHGNAELNSTTWIISHSEASLQLSLGPESWDPSMGRGLIMNKLFLKLENLWDTSLYLLGLFFQLQIRKAISFFRREGGERIDVEKLLLSSYRGWSIKPFLCMVIWEYTEK